MFNTNLVKDHPFEIGQPVWLKPEYAGSLNETYIIVGFYRSMLGSWKAVVLYESDFSAPRCDFPVYCLMDEMPEHMEQPRSLVGTLHFTGTGRVLRAIDGGKK